MKYGLTLFLLLALDSLERGREGGAAAALALSFLGKLFAVALVPIFARRVRPLRIALFFGVVVLGYLPFIDAGAGLWGGTEAYGRNWRFNDSLFALVSIAAGSPRLARLLVMAAFLGLVIRRTLSQGDPLDSAFWLTGAFVLLSPTVHPWYLLWVAPFLCFRSGTAWIVLCASVTLSYGVLIEYRILGTWQEATWVRLCVYVPFYLLLLWEWRCGWKRGGRHAGQTNQARLERRA